MKRAIHSVIIGISPVLVLLAYSLCYQFIENQTKQFFLNPFAAFPLSIVSNALVGVYVLFICKHAFHKQDVKRFPFDYLAGIVLIIISNIHWVLPMQVLFILIFGYGMRMSSLLLGLYIGLFILLIYRRHKAIKHQKEMETLTDPRHG